MRAILSMTTCSGRWLYRWIRTAALQAAGELYYPVELALYAIHGVLHLLGYDDKDAAGRRKMRRAERLYLESFQV